MQATTEQTPLAPVEPAAPVPKSITMTGADGKTVSIAIPRSQAEVDALVRAREELSDQLVRTQNRRDELMNQVRTAPEGVSKTGLEDRIRILDQRLVALEGDLASTGRQLAAAPADLVTWSERPQGGGGDDFEEGVVAGGFTMLAAVAVITVFRRWRGKKRKPQTTRELPADSARLERLEQGMDAIAVEIERVSEGQRFVTKLLAEREKAPVE